MEGISEEGSELRIQSGTWFPITPPKSTPTKPWMKFQSDFSQANSSISACDQTINTNTNNGDPMQLWNNFSSTQLSADVNAIPHCGFPVCYNSIPDLNYCLSTLDELMNDFQDERINTEKSKLQEDADPKGSNYFDMHSSPESCVESVFNALEKPLQPTVGSTSSPSKENHQEHGIDMNKTPKQKKPRRKKFRPKVVREGKPKRTPKSTVMRSNMKKTQSVKRKYVRRNVMNTSKTPSNDANHRATLRSCRRSLNFDLDGQGGDSHEITPRHQDETFQSSCLTFNNISESRVSNLCPRNRDGSRTTILKNSFLDGTFGLNHHASQMLSHYMSFPESTREPTRRELLRENMKALARDGHKTLSKRAHSQTIDEGRLRSFNLIGPVFNSLKVYNGGMLFPEIFKKRRTTTSRKSHVTLVGDGSLEVVRQFKPPIDKLLQRLNCPSMKGESNMVSSNDQKALVPFKGSDMTVIPYAKIKRFLPKVDIDSETNREWEIIMGKRVIEDVANSDAEREKRWKKDRQVFRERAHLFSTRMHLIQGDRRFSKWNGSILDSVVGVFLTQNVSDHLSSSAFISLAAHFPLKHASNDKTCHEEGKKMYVEEPEVASPELKNTKWCKNMPPEAVESQDSQGSVTLHEADLIEDMEMGNNSESIAIFVGAEDATIVEVKSSGVSPQNSIDSSLFQVTVGNIMANKGSDTLLETDARVLEGVVSSKHITNSCIHKKDEVTSRSTETEIFDALPQRRNSRMQQAGSNSPNFSGDTLDGVESTLLSDKKDSIENTYSTVKKRVPGSKKREEKNEDEWDYLRKGAYRKCGKSKRNNETMDSVDWEAVRSAHENEISKAIKARGQNNVLGGRIKDFLNRLVREHESMDLEWLRHVSPYDAKNFLLSVNGLGLKSVECVRLLTLHHHAFPVDTNVARIVVRLGWIPLQPHAESLPLHLLELYPSMDDIQKYLWPRLCTLDQLTLYELHYQLITFGKVFCTKSKPNCNACPMRADCKHFASAYASANYLLTGPEENGLVTRDNQNSALVTNPILLDFREANMLSETRSRINISEPVIEYPQSPEPERRELTEKDIEDVLYDDPDEIPTIKLNMEEFVLNLHNVMQDNNRKLQEDDVEKALALNLNDASLPLPKLKNVGRLRTEHQVYELPDSHPLLKEVEAEKRVRGEVCSYLLAIWTPGETADSIQQPERRCGSEMSWNLCAGQTCLSCNSMREANSRTVRGTILIPCKTAMKGSFPLNGTYFQVNEVFADHESSLNPINVPRDWLWHLPRRTVYFGTSISSIFKGQTTEQIQNCFWRGYICVRGFDRKSRTPRPLMARLHFPGSKLAAKRAQEKEIGK